jgi:hypothetical protein
MQKIIMLPVETSSIIKHICSVSGTAELEGPSSYKDFN